MRPEYREEPCRSALNPVRGMPFAWSLNPYMGCVHRCTFCYVRSFERRADRPWDERYGRSVRIKTNVAEVLRRELARRTWTHEEVVIGAATDPYQPAEGRWRLTRACLEALRDASNPIGIITRGPLVVRDRDVLREAAARAPVRLWVSVPTLDDALWRATEPGTSPPRQRMRAVRLLAEAGIRVSVLMAPIVPGLTDDDAGLTAVVRASREAGAHGVGAGLLYLQPGTREHFLAELERDYPADAERLRALFGERTYLAAADTRALAARMAAIRERVPTRALLAPLVRPAARREPEPPVLARQLGLAF